MWLTQPLVDLAAITARHDIVEAFVTDLELRERLRDQSLRGALSATASGWLWRFPAVRIAEI